MVKKVHVTEHERRPPKKPKGLPGTIRRGARSLKRVMREGGK